MITKKKLRWEIARLHANTAYLLYEKDVLTQDNEALLKERNELREIVAKLEADNKALLETVTMLCNKNKELTSMTRDQRLKLMSYEAIWEAQKRRKEHATVA